MLCLIHKQASSARVPQGSVTARIGSLPFESVGEEYQMFKKVIWRLKF